MKSGLPVDKDEPERRKPTQQPTERLEYSPLEAVLIRFRMQWFHLGRFITRLKIEGDSYSRIEWIHWKRIFLKPSVSGMINA